jgi:adenylate cyclase
MSSQADTEYFSDGISEEVLNVLANIPGLRVASRTSAFSFKGKDAAIPDIARELQVSYILEGSVRRAGDAVRVTAQLIDARSDLHVWSQTFDRDLVEIFKIQDEIAGVIVDRLKPVVLAARGGQAQPSPGSVTSDMVAYDHYLRGRSLYDPEDAAALAQSVASLEKALEMDPEFARAHSALARSLLALGAKNEDADLKQRAAAAARTAVRIDPGLREAHEILRVGTG